MSNENDSFARWQGITIKQFTYAQNLILTFSVAALGFGLAFIKDKDFTPFGVSKCFFVLSLLLLLISIGCGLWCVINRLRDFRITKDISRNRDQNSNKDKVKELRKKSRTLGSITWKLFWVEIGLFSSAILLMTISLIIVYAHKLF
jgi:hypothetical protein